MNIGKCKLLYMEKETESQELCDGIQAMESYDDVPESDHHL